MSTIWDFGRPHTLVATSVSVLCLFTLARADAIQLAIARASTHNDALAFAGTGGALPSSPLWDTVSEFRLLAGVWLTASLINIYIVGLNQITDVDIDRINKPELPLPSGRLRPSGAAAIVLVAAVGAVALGAAQGRWLLWTVVAAGAIGTLYSLPPLRLKRQAIGAALAIAAVRGPIVNLGLGMHFQQGTSLEGTLAFAVALLTGLGILFGFAVAIAKDVPDVPGDRAHAIRTFAVIVGRRRAVWAAVTIVGAALVLVPLAVALHAESAAATLLITLASGGAIMVLARQTLRLRLERSAGIRRFYRSLWLIFYFENIAVAAAFLIELNA